ncbi:50S ribosomal protein L11 methyltransferase [Idiomarina xiamenensis]|uniref:Ribosomal protein L11 methyltransferase n=1 Tax=Idiomarina xiamenensis 10-D-4 TaxID=740709 RepID=K2K9T0_9GAMM|nr:50S ribosomal protein L11 methyltransferase [Idiomarina xiamenensis]EKE84548.1 ribosomal protein L11 methyltransferase [Idiomarina xiamenensis 10-D-4]
MPWIQFTISSSEEHAPQVGDMLMGNGAQAVTYRDGEDNPIFEPKAGEVTYWQHTLVTGLFDAACDINAITQRLSQAALFRDNFQYKVDGLEDKDWEREWMDNFHPIQCADNLWICPTWREVPDPNAVNVMLDPGMAFGTGTHPTTALCLNWLAQQDLSGKRVIDFGCGSGILAIAALLLGAEQAIGIDIDQQALKASRENAERNGVSDRLQVYLPEQQPEVNAEVVVANVLAGPLRELNQNVLALVAERGKIAMSGILARQADDVQAAYQAQISFAPVVQREDWVLLSGERVS